MCEIMHHSSRTTQVIQTEGQAGFRSGLYLDGKGKTQRGLLNDEGLFQVQQETPGVLLPLSASDV